MIAAELLDQILLARIYAKLRKIKTFCHIWYQICFLAHFL